jgi:uncharacterized membrane protein
MKILLLAAFYSPKPNMLKNIRKFFLLVGVVITLIVSMILARPVFAQTPAAPNFLLGKVVEVSQEIQTSTPDGDKLYSQQLVVQLQNQGQRVDVTFGSELNPIRERQRLQPGTQIVLAAQPDADGKLQYQVADTYRLPTMAGLLVIFFVLVLAIARRQGFFSILGMVISVAILFVFIVPQILAGQNPTFIALVGCGAVTIITIYLSHGFKLESHLALASIFLTLVAVATISYTAVHLGYLAGLGSEEASFLQFGSTAKINLQGLLLGGIMLGALGLLDDVTLAQISVVYQLKEAKPHITFAELYKRALVVGKDHVASLVNTLILAYAGSSLPLFLLFTINDQQPAWVTLNSEIIAEEVVRTLSGSIGLVLAVPLATLVATYFASNFKHHAKIENHIH